jgi:hypothetical protein
MSTTSIPYSFEPVQFEHSFIKDAKKCAKGLLIRFSIELIFIAAALLCSIIIWHLFMHAVNVSEVQHTWFYSPKEGKWIVNAGMTAVIRRKIIKACVKHKILGKR